MNAIYKARIDKFTQMLDTLLDSELYRLGDVVAELPPASCVEGVYLFSLPSLPESLAYVGCTRKKQIIGRLKDHQRLTTLADLRGMLLGPNLKDAPQVASDYGVRWISIPDPAERAQFELFAIAILAPPFNRYHISVPTTDPAA